MRGSVLPWAEALIARARGNLLLPSAGVVLALSVVWFAVNISEPRGPLLLLWLPSPVSAAIVTVLFWRTSRTAGLPGPTRRFWGHLCVAVVLVGSATVAQTVDVLSDPFAGGRHTGPVMLALDAAAIMVIIWAMWRLPLGTQSPGERVRVAMDAGTVMVATAVFLWHFHTGPSLVDGADRGTALMSSAVLMVFAFVAVFAVAKVMLSSYAFIDRSALRLLASAMLAGCLSPLPERFLVDQPHLLMNQVSLPLVMFLAGWAAQRQRASQVAPGGVGVRNGRRPFSVLPYLAIAAIDGLLLALLSAPSGGELVIGVAAVVVTGLVVVRQLTAFRDNHRLMARLDHNATHDALTQLPNRRLFNERLHRALTAPGNRGLSIALIDLDDFKAVNDTLGHDVGDALLVAVARRLSACVRSSDTVARLGGDEFVVILDGVQPSDADACAERIIDALGRPVLANGHELLVRASIGIAEGRTGSDAGELLCQADIAMYGAKNLGGSGYRRYEAEMAGSVSSAARVGAELRQAIADRELFLLYQPIVALDGEELIGVEALVRWAHPVRGTLPPGEFIPAAERTGLIVALGRWAVRQACEQLAAWSAEYGDLAPAVVNVNASARELREPGYAQHVAEVLARTGIPPHRLMVEVTETAALELGPSVASLRALQELGVRIALDDFGTGQSTLALLQSCPVDQLKLDRTFTQADLGHQRTMAAAVIHLAGALGLNLVAEGVETPQQAERLRLLGYRAAQGYYFARPMPAADISGLLDTSRTAQPLFRGTVTTSV